MIKRFNHFLTIIILITAVSNGKMVAHASATETSVPQQVVGLYLSPNLCLLEKNQQQCELLLDIRWRTLTVGDYCLHTNQGSQQLNCWSQLDHGQFKHHFQFSKNLEIYLVHQESGETIFRQTVRLQKYVTKYRRKRRNPWQFY